MTGREALDGLVGIYMKTGTTNLEMMAVRAINDDLKVLDALKKLIIEQGVKDAYGKPGEIGWFESNFSYEEWESEERKDMMKRIQEWIMREE